ncbi:MFS transporter [Epilithonimonas hominis]|uniref:MFS transporter n=2 Tax=Epilithonimonas hominis TaxID=420404 RepID=A0A3N0X8G9_9FLAO|nr:hypothetical protein [Epilithonimonas hominis]ROI13666.1 hypothetical protein EGH73_07235 [Epilithonimonas hominis]
MYNKSPFADWVPKPLMLLLILVILFPIVSINGVYTSNATDLSGALATYSEYVALANNAGVIGMGLSMVIALRIKMRFRSKEIITVSCIMLALLSYMCGTTENPWVLVAGSFLIGFFKFFPLIEMILPIMFILSPTGDKGRFYAIFYPLVIGFGQFFGYKMALFTFESNYQAPYFLMSAMMLLIATISLIFQHNQRFCFKKPLYQIDWLSLVLLGSSAMFFNYFFVFMRQQGWFISPYIIGSLISGVILLALTIYRQKFLKRKMIKFNFFVERENVKHGFVLLLFLGVYLASTSIYSQYTLGVLGYNNLINAHTDLYMIYGIVIAGVIAFFHFKKNWNVKYYIAGGFIAFFLHTLCLYLIIQPQMNIEYLNYSMILKGLGMGILFIGIWFYASLDLEMDDVFGVLSILIMVRTFFATAIGSAIIGWAVYQGQWQSLSDMSNYLDIGDIPNGMAIYQNISLNAVMASGKIVLGALCWFTIPVMIYVMTHHYGQFNYRRLALFRKVLRGSSIRGYRLS